MVLPNKKIGYATCLAGQISGKYPYPKGKAVGCTNKSSQRYHLLTLAAGPSVLLARVVDPCCRPVLQLRGARLLLLDYQ